MDCVSNLKRDIFFFDHGDSSVYAKLTMCAKKTPVGWTYHCHSQNFTGTRFVVYGCFQNRGKTPKMDGENNGKPY